MLQLYRRPPHACRCGVGTLPVPGVMYRMWLPALHAAHSLPTSPSPPSPHIRCDVGALKAPCVIYSMWLPALHTHPIHCPPLPPTLHACSACDVGALPTFPSHLPHLGAMSGH